MTTKVKIENYGPNDVQVEIFPRGIPIRILHPKDSMDEYVHAYQDITITEVKNA